MNLTSFTTGVILYKNSLSAILHENTDEDDMQRVLKVSYYVMFLLSVTVAGYGLAFFIIFDNNHDLYRKFMTYPFFAFSHLIGGSIALLFGPLQFNAGFRRKYLRFHRLAGYVYALSVLFGSIGGLYLAYHSFGGAVAHVGFGFLAILWFITTLTAFLSILKKDIQKHRLWMVRSFSLTLAAVSLRIYIPLFLFVFNMPFPESYPIISWMCWVPNIIIAEWFFCGKVTKTIKKTTTPEVLGEPVG